jgi:hypothetical protein
VFRTDRDGQIDIVTDGAHVEVKSWTWRVNAPTSWRRR